MLKKVISLVFAALLAVSCLSVCSSAIVAVPITKLDAPTNIEYGIYQVVGTERIQVAASYTYELSKFVSMDYVEQKNLYGVENVTISVQLDWSIDGSAWNYTEEWDTNPAPENFANTNMAPQACFIYEFFNLETDVGREQAKSIIKSSKKSDGSMVYTFDLDGHTVKFRMRNFLQYYQSGIPTALVSEWTPVYEVKRDAKISEMPTELEMPEIVSASVQYLENGCPYIEYEIKTPESIKKAQNWFAMHKSSYIYLKVETNYEGEDYWNSAEFYDSGMNYIDGKRMLFLQDSVLRSDTTVNVALSYIIYYDNTSLSSKWTETKTFELPAWAADGNIEKKPREVCDFCGICTPIFGVCVFVWLAIVVVAAVIVVVAIKVSKSNKQLKAAAPTADAPAVTATEEEKKELRRQQLERMKAENEKLRREKEKTADEPKSSDKKKK